MSVSIKSPTSTTGSIQLNGSDVLTIDSSGNLTAPNNITANTIIPTSSSAPTNGMFLPTTNTVGVSTNSTERMRIDSSGNVGIGRGDATEKLHVNGLIRIGEATNVDNDSPGLVLIGNDDFLYDAQYINHYGFGFHSYQDGGAPTIIIQKNTYM